MHMFVGLCHCPRNTCPDFTKFSVLVTCSHGSVLLWQWCNMCASGFFDDVMFFSDGP